MKLYSGPLSLFARKVEIALTEKGLRYDRVMVPFTQTSGYSPRNPDVLAANPKGQVPVFVDGPTVLYDSTVIIEYLEDAYPDPPLYPRSAADRARCRMLELFSDEVVVPALLGLAHRTEPGSRNSAAWQGKETAAVRSISALETCFSKLDRDLQSQPYLCGANVTAADVAAFVAVFYVQRLAGPSTTNYKQLHEWFVRLCARKAFASVSGEIIAADKVLSERVDNAFLGHGAFQNVGS